MESVVTGERGTAGEGWSVEAGDRIDKDSSEAGTLSVAAACVDPHESGDKVSLEPDAVRSSVVDANSESGAGVELEATLGGLDKTTSSDFVSDRADVLLFFAGT